METTYRNDLRELNELNFARFDAKLEQRAAQFDAKLEQRIAEVKGELRAGLAELRGEFRAALEAQSRMLIKWMLGFWIATVPTLAGVIVVVQHFLPARP